MAAPPRGEHVDEGAGLGGVGGDLHHDAVEEATLGLEVRDVAALHGLVFDFLRHAQQLVLQLCVRAKFSSMRLVNTIRAYF